MDDTLTTPARQLVEAGAIRWEAGMRAYSGCRVVVAEPDSRPGSGGGWLTVAQKGEDQEYRFIDDELPDLTDPATAALLAVQAMERGESITYEGIEHWCWCARNGKHGACQTLGEAAARALLAIHNGGTP
jgi:hypothetical protein